MTTPNTTTNPATGPTSTSFWVTASGVLVSLLVVVLPQITHHPVSVQTASAIVGGIGVMVSVALKFWHDVKRHQFASAVPVGADEVAQIRSVLAWVVQAVPELAGRVDGIETKVEPAIAAAQQFANLATQFGQSSEAAAPPAPAVVVSAPPTVTPTA